MYRDRDFDLGRPLPWNEAALVQDLELTTLFDAMAAGDRYLADVAGRAVLSGLADPDAVRYRQDVLRDALNNEPVVRRIYDLATESIERERKDYWGLFMRTPGAVLQRSVSVLQMFVGALRKLRSIADEHASAFRSEGFTRFFAMLQQELSDEYFARIHDHLRRLKFHDGALVSAGLGQGNKGIDYVLRKPHEETQSWLQRLLAQRPPVYTVHIHPRDEAGARALAELRDKGTNLVANALGQSTDHILGFFTMLRVELAFYVGCLNLHRRLAAKGEPTCFPVPEAPERRRHSCRGLYDVCLSLNLDHRAVGNDVNADDRDVVIITGANQGGKSTFLRSIGLAQLMMQCGMFVPAESFCANLCTGIYTHYKREEDPAMQSGKFDEELSRMSEIVDHIAPHSLVLFNESFAATNEREGSEIARQITRALVDRHIKVFFVTHLYDFARRLANAIFLRAERQPDGRRTFRLIEGEPLQTTYGEDLYRRIFGPGTDAEARAAGWAPR